MLTSYKNTYISNLMDCSVGVKNQKNPYVSPPPQYKLAKC